MGVTEQTQTERIERPERPFSRRKPQRLAPSIDEAAAAIKKHRALTPAALALGVSRGSLDRQVSRSSRLSWLVHQMRQEVVDLAETKFAQKIQEGNERCILHALSSPIARSRGWGSQVAEFDTGDRPHTTNHFTIELISREQIEAERANKTIEHRADESNRDSLVIEREPGDEGA
jgi:hypothetical protein